LDLPADGRPWLPRRNASWECWNLYAEVQGFELRHMVLVRDFHQMAVDSYIAQHAARDIEGDVPPIGTAYALVGLHLSLDRGVPGLQVRDAHQRMGKPDPSWPRLPAPEHKGSVTIFDVAVAGAAIDSVTGHAEGVRKWAACVWEAWASQHAAIAELADRLLG